MNKFVSNIFPRTPIAQPGMRIGLLGGSFNPPHEGHRHVSLVALKKLKLDKVWWIVTPGNPLKSHHDLLSLEERLQLGMQCSDHPLIEVTGFEAQRNSPYTCETIQYLKRRYAQTRFVWLMGADNLVSFHRWKKWKEIARTIPIAVVDRPGYRHKAISSRFVSCLDSAQKKESEVKKILSTPPPSWTYISGKLHFQSSTELRRSGKTKTN